MQCMFSGVGGVEAGDAAEVPLGSGFSLVKPNDYLLSARTKYDMTGREWEESAKVSRYLVYKHEIPPFPPNNYEEVKDSSKLPLIRIIPLTSPRNGLC
jgi:hypothetical protein